MVQVQVPENVESLVFDWCIENFRTNGFFSPVRKGIILRDRKGSRGKKAQVFAIAI